MICFSAGRKREVLSPLEFEAIVAVIYDRAMGICTGMHQFYKPISSLGTVIRLQARYLWVNNQLDAQLRYIISLLL